MAINHSWVAANQDVAMTLLFGIGYAGIIFEESLAFNKSGVGLIMAVCLWIVRSIGAPSTDIVVAVAELQHASAEVSEIVFFLLGAMTIVETVDSHQGFKLVTDNITTRKPRTLLWAVSFSLCSQVYVFLLDIWYIIFYFMRRKKRFSSKQVNYGKREELPAVCSYAESNPIEPRFDFELENKTIAHKQLLGQNRFWGCHYFLRDSSC
ncbi:hypothetical protein RchiOBHm_Chr6g0255471 [Rosa chinensis]|uniref:Uncharacterized protein n=1 Tax=Rosa chinensis TaxID=74649 RepID=A0A2P6PLV3_ROSCH|nr:hypothetical protein RchiOBHm_Chr6g0255471 [Rosa chinensis]